ncbi:MAG: phenylalanine--tRNA ligase subunit beta [Bacteroidales bacterium]|jgi:phenylalanyl-tRNA synthetase beta chain|nr:phenylalanine--tRNA ligase subunit beta [Bacteroidales bacterium]
MKISLNWLKEYIQFDLSAEETGYYLTDCGLEVEGIEEFETIKGGLKGFVVGEVLTCEAHPDSDHLHLTTVNVGGEKPLDIVCGAANVAAGQKVIVATIGTILYTEEGSFTIKKSKIRGAVSEGMICAEDEIGVGSSHDGILVLHSDAIPGTAAADYFKVEQDTVFEIGLTPNRNDAISHIGIAKDLFAVLYFRKIPAKLILPAMSELKFKSKKNKISIVIENKKDCPRYTGLCFDNVKIKESPDWIKNRLRAIGIRPINNVVDITQFVMFDMGQPLHAFDANFIKGNQVIIKNLPQNTPFITLDGKEIKLHEEDLMICNAEAGMCLAGVYGGLNSGVTAATTSLFLESAYFNAKTVRKTSKRHNIKTDASFRYERGCDPDITVQAIHRVADLLQQYADAEIICDVMDVYPTKIEPARIELSFEAVNALIGKNIDKQDVIEILRLLGMTVSQCNEDKILVTVPVLRYDIISQADLIEEILRIYGYNQVEIPDTIQYQYSKRANYFPTTTKKLFSNYLVDNGFYEVANNSLSKMSYVSQFGFIDEKETVKIMNPLSSELETLRQSLLFSGLENINHNFNNKNYNLSLFEFGKIYQKNTDSNIGNVVTDRFKEKSQLGLWVSGQDSDPLWNHKPEDHDFYYLKNMLQNIFAKSGFAAHELEVTHLSSSEIFINCLQYEKEEQVIAIIGEIKPSILKVFEIKKPVYYAEIDLDLLGKAIVAKKVVYKNIPLYPAVKRDLALVIDQNVLYRQLEEIAYKVAPKLLKNVSLFDVYEGDKIAEGKKSYALNFVLQHPEKTLIEEEINKTMTKIINAFEKELGAVLRS